MKKQITYLMTFFALAAVIFTGCTSTKEEKEFIPNDKIDFLETVKKSDNYLNMLSFTGTVLVSRDGEVLYTYAAGLTNEADPNSAPIKTEDRFEIGSITKQMTAAAIMQLVEQGKLSVNDKISKFFPNYLYGNEISVYNLLTMRSGISGAIYFGKEMTDRVFNTLYHNATFDLDFVIETMNKVPLAFKPDQKMDYNNLNYFLLGYIIETVSGESYDEYMQKHIFDLCQMDNTNMETGNVDVEPFNPKIKPAHYPYFYSLGAGCINSNVYDLNKWMNAFVNGQVVSKETVREMTFGRMKDSLEYGYGFLYGGTKIFHAGSTAGYNSYITYDYDTKYTIIVLCNQTDKMKNASSFAAALGTFWNAALE